MLVKPYVYFKSGNDINNAPGACASFVQQQQQQQKQQSVVNGDVNSQKHDNRGVKGLVPSVGNDGQLLRCLEVIKSIHDKQFPADLPLPLLASDDCREGASKTVVDRFIILKETILVR